MAKKKKERALKKEDAQEAGYFERLSRETKHSIWAIFSISLSLLFVLAAYGKAGLIGGRIYGFLELLFGGAFFLVPLTFFLAGLSFIFSL